MTVPWGCDRGSVKTCDLWALNQKQRGVDRRTKPNCELYSGKGSTEHNWPPFCSLLWQLLNLICQIVADSATVGIELWPIVAPVPVDAENDDEGCSLN